MFCFQFFLFLFLLLDKICIDLFMILVKLQDFYEDLFEELNKYGEIESLNVCDNLADHMVNLCNP